MYLSHYIRQGLIKPPIESSSEFLWINQYPDMLPTTLTKNLRTHYKFEPSKYIFMFLNMNKYSHYKPPTQSKADTWTFFFYFWSFCISSEMLILFFSWTTSSALRMDSLSFLTHFLSFLTRASLKMVISLTFSLSCCLVNFQSSFSPSQYWLYFSFLFQGFALGFSNRLMSKKWGIFSLQRPDSKL